MPMNLTRMNPTTRNRPSSTTSIPGLSPGSDSPQGRPARDGVELRPATPADRPLLERWQRQPHLKEALGDEDWQWARELARNPDWREQLIAEVDGRPIGFLQIIDPAREDSHYWGCIEEGYRALDLWIGEPDALGRGHGTRIMNLAIERCFGDDRCFVYRLRRPGTGGRDS